MNTAALTTGAGAAAESPSVEAAAAYELCARVVRERARNFYYGLRLTPEPKRSAVYSIYAWMRAGDDAADDPNSPEERRAALEAFAQTTRRVLAEPGEAERIGGFWPAFGATLAAYPIRREWIEDMMRGLGDDLEPRAVETMADLEAYCYRVASTVGLVCVSIWGLKAGVSAEQASGLAVRRGLAFQMTNILRDFREDFDASPRRVYVPSELLSRHGLTAEDLRGWRKAGSCERAVGELAGAARGHYEASETLEGLVDPACRPTLWAMTRIYSGLLRRIEDRPSRIAGEKRIRLSGPSKAWIALRAWTSARWAGAR